jgi:hypothetical protein
MSKSKIKIMLICFFDRRGLIYFEFSPEGIAVGRTFHVEELES